MATLRGSRRKTTAPPLPPSSTLSDRQSIVSLADEVESLMLEVELPPLDRFLLRQWIIDPALVVSAKRNTTREEEEEGMGAEAVTAARQEGGGSAQRQRLPQRPPSAVAGPVDNLLTRNGATGTEADSLSLDALQTSRHAHYYNRQLRSGEDAARKVDKGPVALPPTLLPLAHGVGGGETEGELRDSRLQRRPERGTRQQHDTPLPSVEYQRLFELHAALRGYRSALQGLLQAVQARERVWTALQWWCQYILRETSFPPPLLSSPAQATAVARSQTDDDERSGGALRRGRPASRVEDENRDVRSAHDADNGPHPPFSRRPYADGDDRGEAEHELLLPPPTARREARQRGHSAPPPPLPLGMLIQREETHGVRPVQRLPSSARGPGPRPPSKDSRTGRTGPSVAMARVGGSPYFTPATSLAVGPLARGRGGAAAARVKRSGSAPVAREPATPAASAPDEYHYRRSVERGVPQRQPRPSSPRPAGRAERPVSAPTGAVPRSLHTPCILYYLAHLQRTSVAVVRRLREWRAHLSHPFPFVVDRTNYSLELLLQAVRLSDDPALRHALAKQPAAPGAASRPLLHSREVNTSHSPSAQPQSPPPPHQHQQQVVLLHTTPDGKQQQRSTDQRGKGSSPGGGDSRHSYESDAEEERRQARVVAASAASWPEALAAYPLASALPRLSSHGTAPPPPPYLLRVVEAEKQRREGSGCGGEGGAVVVRGGGCLPESAVPTAGAEDEGVGGGPHVERLLLISLNEERDGTGEGDDGQDAADDGLRGSRRHGRGKHRGHGGRSSEASSSSSAVAAAAERWLSREVERQLRCCRVCMAAAIGLGPTEPPPSAPLDPDSASHTGNARPVLLLAVTMTLLSRELTHQFMPLVKRSGQAARLWGQWMVEVDAWQRHLEDASSSMEV